MKQTLAILALTIVTASAYPGHPSHEDWPLDDFSWSMATAAAAVLASGVILLKERSKRQPNAGSRVTV